MKKISSLIILAIVSAAAIASTKSVAGTWMVTNNGKLNPNMKLILSPQGGFKFAGSNYSSSGTYKLDGSSVLLTWTKVDGQPVKPGSMKKTLNLNPDNTFVIDRYTYARKS